MICPLNVLQSWETDDLITQYSVEEPDRGSVCCHVSIHLNCVLSSRLFPEDDMHTVF